MVHRSSSVCRFCCFGPVRCVCTVGDKVVEESLCFYLVVCGMVGSWLHPSTGTGESSQGEFLLAAEHGVVSGRNP